MLRMKDVRLKAFLEGLYFVYNRRELVNPDPLAFLYAYDDPLDREIAGLIASCLAYGRVSQIMKSVERALAPLGQHPHSFLLRGKPSRLLFQGFKHRFTTGEQIADLLDRISDALQEHGSLEALMKSCLRKSGAFLPALVLFSRALEPLENSKEKFPLLAAPDGGSACKRLLLYLKWMVRRDEVDPGCWTVFSPKDLIMPTDTHVHNIALHLGFTKRRQANLKTALEITENFARLTPEDPTRYDFSLTRFGIRGALQISELWDALGEVYFSA